MEPKITGMTALFSQSIGLEEPWYVRSIETRDNEVHAYIDVRDMSKLPCPECGEMMERAGYEKEERVWRHGDCFFYPCYVHCRRPRVRCKEHGIKVVEAPWARKHSRFTLMFEGYAMLMLGDMPRKKVSKLLRCNEKALRKIMNYWVMDAVEKMDLSGVKNICVDETSFKRGQSYVTVVIDGDESRVIDVEENREAKAIEEFSYKLEEKGGKSEEIRQFVCDMSKPYKSGCELCFPNATIVIDKFHVKKLIIDGMDEVRRTEQGKINKRKSGRKLLMIPERRQTEDQRKAVENMSKKYPKTGRAYRMVQSIDYVYESTTEQEASERLKSLISWMKRSRLEPMKRVARTLKERSNNILAYFRGKRTNAIAEGLNSMIQAAKRKARGFKTYEGFVAMIYLVAGKLQLACPKLFC